MGKITLCCGPDSIFRLNLRYSVPVFVCLIRVCHISLRNFFVSWSQSDKNKISLERAGGAVMYSNCQACSWNALISPSRAKNWSGENNLGAANRKYGFHSSRLWLSVALLPTCCWSFAKNETTQLPPDTTFDTDKERSSREKLLFHLLCRCLMFLASRVDYRRCVPVQRKNCPELIFVANVPTCSTRNFSWWRNAFRKRSKILFTSWVIYALSA